MRNTDESSSPIHVDPRRLENPGDGICREPRDLELPTELPISPRSAASCGRRVAELNADECLRLDLAIGRRIARLEAARLFVRSRFALLRPPAPDDSTGAERGFHEFAGDELAAELRVSPPTGRSLLHLAVHTTRRTPAAVVALARGDIDLQRLEALERTTAQLSDGQAGEVARTVLARGGRPSPAAFAAAGRRRVMVIDPDGAERRRRSAAKARRVTVRADVDGMGRLSAFLPADRVAAAFRRVDRLAAKAGPPGDGRGPDERRADVLYELLMGRDHGSVGVEMQVVVSAACLMGISDQPAELPGYGPIPVGLVREMAVNPDCTWRRILTDPVEGIPMEVSRRRYPSAALVRKVQARNPRCLFPGCERPAALCDLDHTVRAERAG